MRSLWGVSGVCFDIFDGRWSSGSGSLVFIQPFGCKLNHVEAMFRHLLVVKALLLEVYWVVQVLGSLEETLILLWRWFSAFGAASFIQVSVFLDTGG